MVDSELKIKTYLISHDYKFILLMQRGLGGFHGAFKLRTQVPQAAPPHERLHQEMSDLI